MWKKLFRTTGLNPENTELVLKKAIEANISITESKLDVIGSSASFTSKKRWQKRPKLTVTGDNGKRNISLPEPSSPTEAKFLVAVLYCLCSMNSVLRGAFLFYQDKKELLETSIASRHGPEKSAYMKRLISDLSNVELIQRLTEEADTALPSEVTLIQHDIIKGLSERYISDDTAQEVMEKFEITPTGLEREISQIARIRGLKERHVPLGVLWGDISVLEHSQLLESAIKDALEAAENEINLLEKELKEADELRARDVSNATLELTNRLEKMKQRSLIARIFNRSVL